MAKLFQLFGNYIFRYGKSAVQTAFISGFRTREVSVTQLYLVACFSQLRGWWKQKKIPKDFYVGKVGTALLPKIF